MSEDTTKKKVDSAKKPGGKASRAKVKAKPREPKPMPDVARMYIEDQTRDQTPMVFVTRDGELRATVADGGKYEHVLNVNGEPTTVKKVTLDYHYKQIDADTVAEKVGHDPTVDTENVRRGTSLEQGSVGIEEAAHPRALHAALGGAVHGSHRLVHALRHQAQHRSARREWHRIRHPAPPCHLATRAACRAQGRTTRP
jgi:hypothetical protein